MFAVMSRPMQTEGRLPFRQPPTIEASAHRTRRRLRNVLSDEWNDVLAEFLQEWNHRTGETAGGLLFSNSVLARILGNDVIFAEWLDGLNVPSCDSISDRASDAICGECDERDDCGERCDSWYEYGNDIFREDLDFNLDFLASHFAEYRDRPTPAPPDLTRVPLWPRQNRDAAVHPSIGRAGYIFDIGCGSACATCADEHGPRMSALLYRHWPTLGMSKPALRHQDDRMVAWQRLSDKQFPGMELRYLLLEYLDTPEVSP